MDAQIRLLARNILWVALFALCLPIAGCQTFSQGGDAEPNTGFGNAESGTVTGAAQNATPGTSAAAGAANVAPQGPAGEEASWNLAELDTARSASFMTETEKDVILEINKARSNPALYAKLYIQPMLERFFGREYRVPGKVTIITNEGAAAAKECIAAMMRQEPRPPLDPNEALVRAAMDHVKDTGPKGMTGHYGSDKSDPMTRVRRYAKNLYVGENISYGPDNAREIVTQFLIDDGVSGRGHRENIMRKEYALIGVSIGGHKVYGSMCVVDFARAPL